MFLTLEDYRKIESWLKLNSKKDTDFDFADSIDGTETVTIVQGNKNKRIFLKNFINEVGNLFTKDLVNVSADFGLHGITLETAIQAIPLINRKEGLVITFEDTNSNWRIHQFIGELPLWNIVSQWLDVLNWKSFAVDSLLPDEEDITATLPDGKGNAKLKFADKEYNPDAFSGLGHVILRKNLVEVMDPETGKSRGVINFLYQDMINKENTVYEINYDFDLNYLIVSIPSGSILLFNGGSISNGNILLSDNTKVLNGKFYNSSQKTEGIKLYQGYEGGYLTVYPCLMIFNHSNVLIEGCTFYFTAPKSSHMAHIATWGNIHGECNNINVKNCTFYGAGVCYWGRTLNSCVELCRFLDTLSIGAIETLYDPEMTSDSHAADKYLNPDNIVWRGNYIDNNNASTPHLLMWLSGASNVKFIDNTFRTIVCPILLYCGDLRLYLDNILVQNNTFIFRNKDLSYNEYQTCIQIRGKSYLYNFSDTTTGNITIENNVFKSELDVYSSKFPYNRGISVSWASHLIVKNNRFDKISRAITMSDSFNFRNEGKVRNERATIAEIYGNTFKNIYEYPITVGNGVPLKHCIISNNYFEDNCTNPEYKDYIINLEQTSQVEVINNIFVANNSLQGIINIDKICNSIIINNKVLSLVPLYYNYKDSVLSSNILQNYTTLCYNGTNKIISSNTSTPECTLNVGDIVQLNAPIKYNDGKYLGVITKFICTKAGSLGEWIGILAISGKAGNNYIRSNIGKDILYCGEWLNINDEVYQIIDINYEDNQYFLNKSLKLDLDKVLPARINYSVLMSERVDVSTSILSQEIYNGDFSNGDSFWKTLDLGAKLITSEGCLFTNELGTVVAQSPKFKVLQGHTYIAVLTAKTYGGNIYIRYPEYTPILSFEESPEFKTFRASFTVENSDIDYVNITSTNAIEIKSFMLVDLTKLLNLGNAIKDLLSFVSVYPLPYYKYTGDTLLIEDNPINNEVLEETYKLE